MAAAIMKSLVNQWHHSSSYLAIASVCLSTAREPSRCHNTEMQLLVGMELHVEKSLLKNKKVCAERERGTVLDKCDATHAA